MDVIAEQYHVESFTTLMNEKMEQGFWERSGIGKIAVTLAVSGPIVRALYRLHRENRELRERLEKLEASEQPTYRRAKA